MPSGPGPITGAQGLHHLRQVAARVGVAGVDLEGAGEGVTRAVRSPCRARAMPRLLWALASRGVSVTASVRARTASSTRPCRRSALP